MNKVIFLAKTFSLTCSLLFCALSYSNNLKKDCYAQFFDSKKSSLKLPENLYDRDALLKEIQSNPNKHADLMNLPEDPKIIEDFFNIVTEAAAIPFAKEIHPIIAQQENDGKTEIVMPKVNITFKPRNHNSK